MNSYHMKAYAKINLGLDVLRRLENGYHEVRMVMQSIGLYDELTFTRGGSGIRLFTNAAELPVDESNLICRAVRILMDRHGITEGIEVRLDKRIPVAAGMAGGSTDAAAAFRGVNELFDLGHSLPELMTMGTAVGADVPYCIMGGTALAEGIGEQLTALPPLPRMYVVTVTPKLQVSTKAVYEQLDAAGLREHPDITGMAAAIGRGERDGIISRMGNVLESVTIQQHPVIGQLKEQLLRYGALNSLMSGSGPTVFGLFDTKEKAEWAGRSMREEQMAGSLYVTEFVG